MHDLQTLQQNPHIQYCIIILMSVLAGCSEVKIPLASQADTPSSVSGRVVVIGNVGNKIPVMGVPVIIRRAKFSSIISSYPPITQVMSVMTGTDGRFSMSFMFESKYNYRVTAGSQLSHPGAHSLSRGDNANIELRITDSDLNKTK